MVEIERKFLVNTQKWRPLSKGIKIRQGYLSTDPERVVRVRIAGEKAFITIKGKTQGIKRIEVEFEVPKTKASVLMQMCTGFLVEKTRYTEKTGGLVWEIDVFEGSNKGLVMAEVELKSENQAVELPDWAGEEVSYDSRYFNARLSEKPFTKWSING